VQKTAPRIRASLVKIWAESSREIHVSQ